MPSTCAVCRALTLAARAPRLCLRHQEREPSPPMRMDETTCVCGARLRRTPGAWYCGQCGSDFPDA